MIDYVNGHAVAHEIFGPAHAAVGCFLISLAGVGGAVNHYDGVGAALARLRELLLPLLLLPVLAPVLIASTEATVGVLRDPSELSLVWITFLTSFDVVFLTAAWLVGEYLLEE